MPDHNLAKQQLKMAASVSFEPDEELAWRATQEVEAFQELYHRYNLPVYRYHIAQTGNERVAQDLTCQTFLSAFESITSYRFRGRFLGRLFRIANHELDDHFRKRGDKFPPDAPLDFPGNGSSLEQEANFQIKINAIARAIDALTEEMAEAVTLRFFAGLNPSEIGLIMVKSDAAVKMLVYRGIYELKVRLSSKLEIENDGQRILQSRRA